MEVLSNVALHRNDSFKPFSPPQQRSNFFASIVSDLANHPYPPVPSQLPINQKLFEFSLRPQVPLVIVCVYLASIALLNKFQDGRDRMKGPWWKATLALHNILLAVYSGWTFLGTGPATFRYFWKGFISGGLPGLIHTFCDSSMVHWDSVMAPYSYLFYLSKFWEILDTLILIGKGKKASLLQEYHHAGAILTVWSGMRYESPASWLFVVLNSFIHTIMYTYYTLSVLRIRVPGVLKRALTKVQIAQFIVGGSLGALTLLLSLPKQPGDGFEWQPVRADHPSALARLGQSFHEDYCLRTAGQQLTVVGGVGYLIPLTGLFVSFYIRSYRRRRNSVKKMTNEKLEKQD